MSLDAVRVLSESEAKGAKGATIELKGKKVALAATDPESAATKNVVDELIAKGYEVKVVVVSPSSVDTAWHFYQFVKPGRGERSPERWRSRKSASIP